MTCTGIPYHDVSLCARRLVGIFSISSSLNILFFDVKTRNLEGDSAISERGRFFLVKVVLRNGDV